MLIMDPARRPIQVVRDAALSLYHSQQAGGRASTPSSRKSSATHPPPPPPGGTKGEVIVIEDDDYDDVQEIRLATSLKLADKARGGGDAAKRGEGGSKKKEWFGKIAKGGRRKGDAGDSSVKGAKSSSNGSGVDAARVLQSFRTSGIRLRSAILPHILIGGLTLAL